MKKWIEIIPSWARNQYFISGVAFCVWVSFFDSYNFIYHYKLKTQKRELEAELFRLSTETDKNNAFIQLLQNPEFAEQYAREKFYMKKEGEDIFVIEALKNSDSAQKQP